MRTRLRQYFRRNNAGHVANVVVLMGPRYARGFVNPETIHVGLYSWMLLNLTMCPFGF